MNAGSGPGVLNTPRNAEADRAMLRSIRDAGQAGDIERATAMAVEALGDGLEHPIVLNFAALDLENKGMIGEAAALLRRAVELAPGDIGARNALGLCLNRMEAPEEALEHFNALLAIDANFTPAYVNRGAAFDAFGALDKAESDYRRALELMPGNAGALSGLASIMARKGAYAEARSFAGQALAAAPGFPEATMTLASADLGEGDAARAEARLMMLLDDPRLPPLERGLAFGALGDALDAQDRTSEAFEAHLKGNEERRRHYESRFADRTGTVETVRWMTERLERAHSRAVSHDFGKASGSAEKHVFLLGFPRSGTTLLEQILASHADVAALEERESLIDSMREFLRAPADMDRLFRADRAALAPFRDLYWRRVAEAGVDARGKVFVDKHPLNTLKLPLIATLFPEAKVLFALRDPRDVVLSCFRRRFRMSAPYYQMLTLRGAADLYDATMRFAVESRRALRLDVHVVRHESLVADFDAEVGAICAFVGLPWSDAMRDFAARTRDRSISTPSGAQLARGLNAGGIGQWRRYRAQVAPILPVLEHWVEYFSYGGDP